MARIGKALGGLAVAIGLPVLVVGQWQQEVRDNPVRAALLVLAWELIVAIGYLAAKIVALPASRRLEQVGDAVDLALGRRVSRYGRRYRQWVVDSKRFMEARGLATVGDFTPELDEVFVDVSLAPRAPHMVPSGILTNVSVDVVQRYSIWDFLDDPAPLVLAVIGVPGSGKTTLLNHVARRIAQTPRRRRRPVPVLLQLRDHARKVANEPGITLPALLRGSMPTLPVGEPPGWWGNRLQRGKCVVLLDGLDEVATAEDRVEITAWINRQIAVYPRNQYVITSRPHGYRTAAIDSAQTLQVRAFTDEQVHRFLHGWYLAVERRATGTVGREVEIIAEEAANDLLTRLATTPALYDLTVNPLLLTMVANVHRYRGSLPGSRADLYGEVCQVMLWRRQEAKKMTVDLPGASKERLLAHVAFLMMQRRDVIWPRQQVLDEIKPGLRRISTSSDAEAFLADVGSNGLLVEREKDQYAFAHLTFQEYLAARHIQDHKLEQILIDAVDDPWWRETTLLYVAGADADSIVKACLGIGSTVALSLAFECVDAGAELAHELRTHLSQALATAYHANADPEHRRLVAGVLAARHLRQLVTTSAGTPICTQPITASLYWLFLQDSKTPRPDGHCAPGIEERQPATGMWASDVASFVAWINSITVSGRALHRLPTAAELDDLVAKPGPAAHLLGSMTNSLWSSVPEDGGRLRLWTPSGNRSPRRLTRRELLAGATQDISNSALLARLLSLSVRGLTDALAVTCDRAPDRAATLAASVTAVRSRIVAADTHGDLSVASNLTRTLTKDLARDKELAIAIDQALALAQVADLESGLLLVVAHHLARYRDRDIIRDLAQASSLERDISIGAGWGQDGLGLTHASDHARALSRALTRARSRVAKLVAASNSSPPHEPGQLSALDRALALDLPSSASGHLRLGGGVRAVLGEVVGTGLAPALLALLRHENTRHENSRLENSHYESTRYSSGERASPAAIFATELAGWPNQPDTKEFEINLDRLAGVAREALTSRAFDDDTWAGTVAGRLAAVVVPVLARGQKITNQSVMLIRLPAMALAAEAREWRPRDMQLSDQLQRIAMAATLLRRRARQPDSLEAVILARTR